MERCPDCGEDVPTIFEHVDRFRHPDTGACIEVNDPDMTNQKWDAAVKAGTWRQYVKGAHATR